MLPSIQMFSSKGLAYFSNTMLILILLLLQQHGFAVEESERVLKWPACGLDFSTIDNIWPS